MKKWQRVLVLASPWLLLVAIMVWVYNLQASDAGIVTVRADVEDAVSVQYSGEPDKFIFEFYGDGTARYATPAGMEVAGTTASSAGDFLASLPENTAVYAVYQLVDDSAWRGRPAALRKVHFAPISGEGVPRAIVYREEYPLDFGGWWGQYSVRRATALQVTIDWTNRGNVVWTLFLLFFAGPFFSVVAMWRLGLWLSARTRPMRRQARYARNEG